jgi:hypothetical protein
MSLEVSMLVEQAWRMCAPKRLVAELDDERRRVRPAAEDG